VTDPRPKLVELCNWLVEGGPSVDTEWLGDAYQHYCQDARKGRALVQTPDFVRELILDKTLGKVLSEWGPMAAKTIDPTCGCGHFLVDAFRRTFAAWKALPGDQLHAILVASGGYDTMDAILAQIALDQVVGVDLDPVCVAVSRARLLMEAWAVSDVRMPYRLQVYEGDALLHGRPLPGDEAKYGPWGYDVAAVRRALAPGQYSAVVGNPPYIRCKDAKLRDAYRERYPTCHMNFSLAVPFTELFFGLARRGTAPAEIADPVTREHQGVLFVDAA
jgi:hypothetical protein